MKNICSQMIRLLDDEMTRVIALTGEWGVGKTFVWEQIQSGIRQLTQNQDLQKEVKDALYASVFGVHSIKELETRLVLSRVSEEAGQMDSQKCTQPFKELYLAVEKCLPEEYRFGKVIGSFVESFLFCRVAQGCLVVIDDVERKSQALKAGEFLGFVENLTRIHKCKVLLILNKGALADEDWDALNEKVIDYEVKLERTSAAAFNIALDKQKWPQISEENKVILQNSLSVMGVNNIRAIRKIVRKINYLLGYVEADKRKYIEPKLSAFALITAAYYRLLEHEVLWEDFSGFNPYDIEGNKANKKRRLMTDLVLSLNLNIAEPINEFYYNYISTGIVDEERLGYLIKELEAKSREEILNQVVNQLSVDFYWNPNKTNEYFDSEIVKIIAQISEQDCRVRPYEFSHLLEAIDKNFSDFHNRKPMLIDKWLQDLESRCQKEGSKALDNVIHDDRVGYLKSQIEHEFKRLSNKYKEPVQVEKICLKLRQKRGWTIKDESDLDSLTVDHFKDLIYDTANENWLIIMLELAKLKNTPDHFVVATDNFQKACEYVLEQDESMTSTRLQRVLRRILE